MGYICCLSLKKLEESVKGRNLPYPLLGGHSLNNPLQLVNRLELLAGSIFAGNNGVKQEFSQIAHLLHQLKVITKKQLNDLLK